jgi:IMP and pyridine-specific 5'-nucleotidase
MLVPSVGTFFTPLYLHDAFVYQDSRRLISHRRFVPPSFNDIRLMLNTAQVMSLTRDMPLELVTFDGDVTLYDDGESLTDDNPVIPRILALMQKGTRIGLVTAAGYVEARRYYERLHGLLDAVNESPTLSPTQKQNLVVMGGEANFLFKFSEGAPDRLKHVPRKDWLLEEMLLWQEEDITELLDVAEVALRECITNMRLEAQVLRKERAVGIIPGPGKKLAREQLEETVLVAQKILVRSSRLVAKFPLTLARKCPLLAADCPFARSMVRCIFHASFVIIKVDVHSGGNDVFVDIGDKSWGVKACQHFFGGIEGARTLHVGDQFLSAGSNDFKARLACTTAWIANPAETVQLLDEIAELDELVARKKV